MSNTPSFSKLLRENLKLEAFKVEDAMSHFGITHKAGSIVYDKSGTTLYLILKDTIPKDTIVELFKTHDITVLGSDSSNNNGVMMKIVYDTNNNGVVDNAEALSNGEYSDDLNPHNINSRANITGNEKVYFKVKAGFRQFDAINLEQ